jgi:type II secretory pathway pseudopilin PulG
MPARRRDNGFTYLGVLIVVALAGISLAGLGELWSTSAKRDKEAELLFVGGEIRRAIGHYVDSSPGGAKRYPAKLEELLEDPRYPTTRRHLRRIYVDPMTGTTNWGLVRGAGGGITGVYSRSEERPLKVAGFSPEDAAFANAARYAEWRFVHDGGATGEGTRTTPGGASGLTPPNPLGTTPLSPSGGTGAPAGVTPSKPSGGTGAPARVTPFGTQR